MEVIEAAPIVSYRDEFYPSGFRKLFALLVIASATTLPPLFAWQSGSIDHPGASFPTGRFGPRGGFLPDRDPPGRGFLNTVWTVIKGVTKAVIVTAGLMLYYPRRGFKRYSLICGPVIAWLAPLCVAFYLAGRVEVFRFEIVLVALIGALPGAALYVWLTWRKAQRLGMVW